MWLLALKIREACKDGGLDDSLQFNISSNSKIELIFK